MIPWHRCREPLDQGQLPIVKPCLESIMIILLLCIHREVYVAHQTNAIQTNFTIFSGELESSVILKIHRIMMHINFVQFHTKM